LQEAASTGIFKLMYVEMREGWHFISYRVRCDCSL